MSSHTLPPPPVDDWELLSAYIDGQLNNEERQLLEKRLAAEPQLQAELASLRETVALIQSLPRLKAPRDFRLDPAQFTRQPAKVTRLTWRYISTASAVASLLLVIAGVILGGTGDFTTSTDDESGSNAVVLQRSRDTIDETPPTHTDEQRTALAFAPTPSPMPSLVVETTQKIDDDQSSPNGATASSPNIMNSPIPARTQTSLPLTDDALADDAISGEGENPMGESADAPNTMAMPGQTDGAMGGAGGAGETNEAGRSFPPTAEIPRETLPSGSDSVGEAELQQTLTVFEVADDEGMVNFAPPVVNTNQPEVFVQATESAFVPETDVAQSEEPTSVEEATLTDANIGEDDITSTETQVTARTEADSIDSITPDQVLLIVGGLGLVLSGLVWWFKGRHQPAS